MDNCECCRQKNTPRDEKTLRSLKSRLNRITGQLNGIGKMLDENRYCGDILIQIAAAVKVILQEHMKTCLTEEIKKGNNDIMDEALELIKKLK